MPVDELGIPGRHNVSNALAAIAVGLLFGVAPDAIRRAAAAFTGVEHRLQSVGLVDGVRFVNDSQGTQPDAVIAALRAFPAPVVLIAGGRDKGVDLSELARVAGATAARRGPDRRERPDDRGACCASRPRADRARRDDGRGRRRRRRLAHLALGDAPEGAVATVVLSPAAASFDMFEDYAARGRAFIDAVGRLAATRGRTTGRSRMSTVPLTAVRAPAEPADRTRANTLQRERHEPEYGILVATVALAAIGILMVYSSSAIKSYLQRDDPFAIVGPADPVGGPGARRDGGDDAGRLPLAPRGLGAAVRDRRHRPAARVHPGDQHRGRRLGALAQDRPAAGGPPGRVHEARARRVPRALVREAGHAPCTGS